MTNLPKGGHDTKDEVDLFYVRKLVQNLGIDEECARSVIPALPRIKKTSDS